MICIHDRDVNSYLCDFCFSVSPQLEPLDWVPPTRVIKCKLYPERLDQIKEGCSPLLVWKMILIF